MPERRRRVITTRRYTNPRLPLPLLTTSIVSLYAVICDEVTASVALISLLSLIVQRSSASPDRGKYDWSRSPGGASDSGIAKCRKLDDKVRNVPQCGRNYCVFTI